MLLHLIIGGLLIAANVIFHALALDFIIKKMSFIEGIILRKDQFARKAIIMTIIVLAVVFVLIVEIWMWALLYIGINVFDALEPALYFSISAFTTVGFGDLVLDEKWRLISAIESTSGFLLFGWSTAFIFEIVSKLYRSEGKAMEE